MVDIILILLFIGMIFVGFFKGIVKMLISLVGFYLSIVLSSLYYRTAAQNLFTNTDPYIGQVVSFFLVLFICFFILLFAGLYTFRHFIVGGKLGYVDKLVGMAIGLILGLLLSSVVAMLFTYLFINNQVQATEFPAAEMLGSSTMSSAFRPVLINNILPVIYATIDPFLPEEAGLIFSIR